MGVHDAPQWLIPAWVRTCVGAGATAPHREIEQVGESLLARWSEPSRHYHNARHLADVLATAVGVGGPLGGIEDGTVIPGREPDQLGLVGLLGELVDVGEDVGQVAGVVVVPAGL